MQSPVAVVTGASSGIGQAIAIEFARAGYHLFLHGNKNTDGLNSTKASIQAIYTQRGSQLKVATGKADLSDPGQLHDLFQNASNFQRRIDAWVNAAGADVLTGEHKDLTFDAKLEMLWQVDVRGTILLSRLAADFMSKQDCEAFPVPCIVNLSWDQAERGMAGDSGQFFGATKSAIASFTKALASSIGPKVRANCVAPGWIKTAWGHSTSSEWHSRATGESAMHRWGTPEDIASTTVWLCSQKSEFVNGQTIAVNGGWKPNYEN